VIPFSARFFATLSSSINVLLPWVQDSPAPLLLPANITAIVKDRISGAGVKPIENYLLADVLAIESIDADAAGYDVILSKQINGVPQPVYLFASRLIYDVPAAKVSKKPSTIRAPGGDLNVVSFIRKDEQRLSFKKYGIDYVLSVACGHPVQNQQKCEAERNALLEIASSLQFAGIRPELFAYKPERGKVARPEGEAASDFSFYPPGELVNGSGAGRPGYTVYASLLFPLKEGPAFANSQVFGDAGHGCTGNDPCVRGVAR